MSTDLVPENAFTRIVILYVMVAGAIFLPSNLSELLDLIRQKSKYSHSYKPESNIKHIVVTGGFDETSLYEFLREFFCQDHGLATMSTEVVVLNHEEPEENIALLLEDPAFTTRVQYVKGSATLRRSLEKVRIDIASAVFLLSKKFSKNDDEDDAAQILRALAIKKYNNKIPLYAQIHSPVNVPHFDFLAKDIICIDEIAMGLMAQSLIIPGFSSLIVLLTTSITKKIANKLTRSAKKKQEIYAVTFSKDFIGKTFLECSKLVYNRLGAVLFSIGIYRIAQSSKESFKQLPPSASPFQIFLNPQDYVIDGNEIGFVVCGNAEITVKMAQFVEHVQIPYYYRGLSYITQSARDLFTKKNGKSSNINDTPTENNLEHTKLQIPAATSNVIDSEIVRNNINNAAAYCFNEKSEIPHVTDHVLICNHSEDFPVNLDIFMMVLRGKNSNIKDAPIVILSPNEPDDYQKRSLSKFSPVYFINGSPLKRKDLYKARVHYAKKCVILSDSLRYEESSNGTADAASIMIALNIESMAAHEECFVIVECIYRETFKMIGESDSVKNKQDDNVQALLRPSFMSGNVFTPSNLDTLLCQCFYNKHIPVIVKRLIFSHDPGNKKLTPKVTNVQDNEWQSLKIGSGQMFQIDVPSSFFGKEYHLFYDFLIQEHKAVPLGLYRLTQHKGGHLRYIYVNPKAATILRDDDRTVNKISNKQDDFEEDEQVLINANKQLWEKANEEGLEELGQEILRSSTEDINNRTLKVNIQLPWLVSNVVELLDMDPSDEPEEDGANIDLDAHRKGKCAVIKTSTRQTIFLPLIGLVDPATIKPGDLIGVNKDSYLVLDTLPAEYDSRVKAMEVDEKPAEDYNDIGGLDKQIEELVEAIVLPMTHAERFKNLGIKPPKGVLMYGPPGTGKTLLARACAAQTNSAYLKLAGPQLVQAPAIIFIDELDAIGTKRFDSEKSGDREVQRTMLELLNQLDGFSSDERIKVIAATNRIDILDPALLRSGGVA
ncbi:17741_t:CDS:10, partial [Entrophospora sp. SA101]